jgi:hypothetical protein
MPYSVGEKGSYGCSGYPVIKDDDKSVMGCHDTAQKAGAQIAAIEANESKTHREKDTIRNDGGMGIKNPDEWPVSKASPCWDGYTQRGMKPGRNGKMVPNCVPISKAHDRIVEGDYVMGKTSQGIVHGMVEHIMWEGGTLGIAGQKYSLESMPPENPAMSVRVYQEEDQGVWEPTALSIGMMYKDAERIETLMGHTMPEYMNDEIFEMFKAETFTPNTGMKAAARRALKWKEEGKATGAGTPVGWGRASDIVAGRSMSLSIVRRMFSFFSRHEVDKKGKDFYNTSNPSNGRIMWDAWGGDAGFSWSRGIVNRMRDKALFADFGKDYTRSQSIVELFKAKSVSVGDHVMFGVPKPPAATEYAHGEVERIERSGKVTIGNESVQATSDNPVAVVRVWAERRGGGYIKTDRRVAKPFSNLRVSSQPLDKIAYEDNDISKAPASLSARLSELAENYNKGKEGNKRITVAALRQVYNRGIGAYRTNPGSVRGTVSSAEQWAMGRVNAFMAGLRGRFPRKPFDLDLFPSGHPRSTKKLDDGFSWGIF